MSAAPAKLQKLAVALLLLGALPLALSVTTWWYGVLPLLAALAGGRVVARSTPPKWLPMAVRVAVLLAVAWSILDWRWLGTTGVAAIAHFLVLLSCCKLFEPRRTRDLALLLLISLMLLLVSGLVSAELAFPLALGGFALLGPYTAILLHMQREHERSARLRGAAVSGGAGNCKAMSVGPLGNLSVGIGLGCALFGVLFFVVFPRYSERSTRWLAPARSLAGFSPNTTLDVTGSISDNDAVVMRVWVTRDGEPVTAGAHQPYLRGITRSRYRRVRRARSNPARWLYSWPQFGLRPWSREIRLGREDEAADLLEGAPEPDPENELRYDIQLERRGGGNLFVPYPALALHSTHIYSVRKILADQTLEVLSQSRSGSRKYTVWGTPNPTPEHVAALQADRRRLSTPTAPQPEYLPVGEPVRELALQLWNDAGQPDVYDATGRSRVLDQIVAYLRSDRFAYTLDVPERPAQAEPVEHFLFTAKRGHCELYATTMAVLCQILGIPARYVSGYLAIDYNPVAECFVVRQNDAHAWVEAFVPGRDWVTYDPTPWRIEDREEASLWLAMRDYMDYLKYRWVGLVISFDATQRREMFSRLSAWTTETGGRWWEAALARPWARMGNLLMGPEQLSWGWRLVPWLAGGLLLVLAAAVLRIGYRLVRRFGGIRLTRVKPPAGWDFYQRLLKVLASAGFRPGAFQTPREFVDGVIRRKPAMVPAGRVVERYYATRYGCRPVGPAEELELAGLLKELAAAVRQGGRSSGQAVASGA